MSGLHSAMLYPLYKTYHRLTECEMAGFDAAIEELFNKRVATKMISILRETTANTLRSDNPMSKHEFRIEFQKIIKTL